MFGFISKKRLIKEFAQEIAYMYMKADKYKYVHNDEEMRLYVLSKLTAVLVIANRLCITTHSVYDEAYKIYDFRNSGIKGYVPDLDKLKDI